MSFPPTPNEKLSFTEHNLCVFDYKQHKKHRYKDLLHYYEHRNIIMKNGFWFKYSVFKYVHYKWASGENV